MPKPKLRFHPLFILLGVVMAAMGQGYAFGIYLLSLLIHECAHSLAAHRLGFAASQIELLPTGAVLYGAFDGISVGDEIKIALAGPLVNIIIALICIAFWWIVPQSYGFTDVIVAANLTTGLFNLLPAYPLDGGRIALCLLSLYKPYKTCLKIVRAAGIFLSLAVFAFYIISIFSSLNITYALIGIFLMQGALYDLKENMYNKILSDGARKKLKTGLVAKTIYVSEGVTLQKLINMLNQNYYYEIVVVRDDFTKIKRIEQKDLPALLIKNNLYTPLGASK
jgi:stage IV sporulation protein FB